jgi:hypothetical protein
MEVRSVEAVVKALNEAKVQYLIVGGLAVNAHGYERFTNDVDLVIGLERDNITRGLRALIAIGYQMKIPVTPEQFANPVLREAWRREKDMTVLPLWSDVHRRTPVDVFVYEPFDFSQEYNLARREPVAGTDTAPVIRLETLLKMKRGAARPQDLADIADLERLQELKKEFPK